MAVVLDFGFNTPNAALAGLQGFDHGQQAQIQQAQEARAVQDQQQQDVLFQQGQQDRATELQAKVEAQNRLKAAQAGLAGLHDKVVAGSATSEDFAAFMTQYPELAGDLKPVWDGMSAERKQNDIAMTYRAGAAIKAGKPELAASIFDEYAKAAENSGKKQDADIAKAMAETIRQDPQAALTTLGFLLQSADPKANGELFGVGSKKTVQSNVTLADGTTVSTFNDGSKQVSDAAGNVITGQAAIDAVKSANEYDAKVRNANANAAKTGTLEATIAQGGAAAGAEAAGKLAIETSGKAYESLGKINSNIANIDRAIAAIDAGARTGAIDNYLPNISAAANDLQQTMNTLGLDVVGAVTFGALSEGEMKLAMETAVPSGMDEAALRDWLVKKKEAQQKASNALYKAAVYLGTPGNTIAGWLKEKGNAPGGQDAPTSTGSAAGGAGSQLPTLEEAEALRKKYGGP